VVGDAPAGGLAKNDLAAGDGRPRATQSRLIVFTKVSAMPSDSGLLAGVVTGRKPRIST
jgi:hypothetical protein